MAQDYSKSRKMESQPLPENNPLYRFWMLREDPNGKVVKHSCFSYVNRNNPKKCYNYAKTIHLRIKDDGYIWLIDNLKEELLEVYDLNHWRLRGSHNICTKVKLTILWLP